MSVSIKGLEYYLPEIIVSNDELKSENPLWDVDKVGAKSGVFSRHIAGVNETALDLASHALKKLLESEVIKKDEIDGIIFCTQSPDFIMPSNAFLIHKDFEFSNKVWAFDYNLACSGFVYGMAIARGMIASGMGENILLITADTYSKYISKLDRSTSMLFGDGAAVTVFSKSEDDGIIDILLSSAGEQYNSFYIPAGGSRNPKSPTTSVLHTDSSGNSMSLENIQMNGFAVWKFISQIVPKQICDLLEKNKLEFADIDKIIFHQASKLTLDSLTKVLKVDPNKVFSNLNYVGNTVSASIPIALKDAVDKGFINRGDTILISGFGVGLSWGSALIKY